MVTLDFVTLAAEDYQLAALGQVVELHNVGQRLFALLRKALGVTYLPCLIAWLTLPVLRVTLK